MDQLIIVVLLFLQMWGTASPHIDKKEVDKSPGVFYTLLFLIFVFAIGTAPLIYMWLLDHLPFIPPQHMTYFQASVFMYTVGWIKGFFNLVDKPKTK